MRSIRQALAPVTGCEDTEAQAVCRTIMAVIQVLRGQVAGAEREAEHALALLGRSAPAAARGRAVFLRVWRCS